MSSELNLHQAARQAVQTNPDQDSWTPAVREHVFECTQCRKNLEASLQLRAGLRRLGESAPLGLLDRVRTDLAEASVDTTYGTRHRAQTSSAGNWASRAWAPAALAAGLVLGIGLGPLLRSHDASTPQVVNGEVVQSVSDCLFDVAHDRHLLERTGRPIEYPGSDLSEVSQWLSEATGFEVRLGVPPRGWRLSGGRVWHTVSRISALAEYDLDGRRVTIFAVPATEIVFDHFDDLLVGENMWSKGAWSFQAVTWYDGRLLWSAVSDLPQSDLVKWARGYRGEDLP